jgi:hypothetical protein
VTRVYTKQLLSLSGNGTVSAAAPSGKLWVVKDIVVAATGPVGAVAVVLIEPSGIYLYYFKATADPQTGHEEMTQAVPPGQNLLIQIVDPSNGTALAVTGFEFEAT